MATVDVEIDIVCERVDGGAGHELGAETGHGGIERGARGFEEIADELAGCFVADGDANGGGCDAGLAECVGIEFAVRGERRAEDECVALARSITSPCAA